MVRERPEGTINPNMATGHVEVLAHELEVLNRSETPPFHHDEQANEDIRLKYRYLDLRREGMLGNLRLRHRVTRALRAFLDAEGFVDAFPEGFHTLVGERGVRLSGGQKQRIAIARAVLKDPAILILDDATSAIDSETEDRIQRAIERAAANRTTFLITHRLSQIRWADKVVLLRKGRVEAVGSHDELMALDGRYARLFSLQAEGYR